MIRNQLAWHFSCVFGDRVVCIAYRPCAMFEIFESSVIQLGRLFVALCAVTQITPIFAVATEKGTKIYSEHY